MARLEVSRLGSKETRDVVANDRGEIELPWESETTVHAAPDGHRVVLVTREGAPDRRTTVVVLAPTVRIELLVRLADGASVDTTRTATVAAASLWRPLFDAPRDERPASLDWIASLEPRALEHRLTTAQPTATFEVAAVADVAVAAHVHGYYVGHVTLPRQSLRGEERVTLDLRPAETWAVTVADEQGGSIAGAVIQHVVYREMRLASYNEQLEVVLKRASGVGYGATWSKKDDTARVERVVQFHVPATGAVQVVQPFRGEHRVIITHAPGFIGDMRRVASPTSEGALDVTLRRRPDSAPKVYQLIYKGDRVDHGTLHACEEIDGWTPCLPPIAGRDGWFPGAYIDPHRTYTVVLEWVLGKGRSRSLSGRLSFGMSERVDISTLTED
jgi:hypothetical protein